MERNLRAGKDLERKIRERERQRLRRINNQGEGVLEYIIRAALFALAIMLGTAIWIWAAGRQAEMEAQAAVLRSHRITDGSMYSWGPGVTPGQNQNCPILVPELPDFPPVDGEPPQAIEIKMASKADAVPTGTENAQVDKESSETESWESMGVYQLTFYCPCYQCSEGWGHQTASGARAVEGITIAADPSVPFGTHLLINGQEYIVQDRGGSIKGRKIDVFMESHSRCLKNGIQKAEVFILR